MTFRIRPARHEDVPVIAGWTKDTFSWGDYVGSSLAEWLEDESMLVVVCVLEDDDPVGVARAQMLSPTEAWLSAARVHPEHRRAGLGRAMNDHAVAWAVSRGARVARLSVDEENTPARAQVEGLGYRPTSIWLHAELELGPGRRLDQPKRLEVASSADIDPAWLYWQGSELAAAGRDLLPRGWSWRTGRRSDLEEAAKQRGFLVSPAGWVVVTAVGDTLEVRWMATWAEDAPLLLHGLVDRARDLRLRTVELKTPETPWLAETLVRQGFSTDRILVYEKPV